MKYVYYHCTGNRGQCAGKKNVREEELIRQFGRSLADLSLDDVVSWIIQALKGSHEDEKRFRNQTTNKLLKQREKIQKRLDALYVDKLDGVITTERYECLSAEWSAELADIAKRIEQLDSANKNYLDFCVKLLELAQQALIIYKNQNNEEKRKILKTVHSNSFWKDGELTVNYEKPFDLLALTNKAYKQKKATFPEKSDLHDIWLPVVDELRTFGGISGEAGTDCW